MINCLLPVYDVEKFNLSIVINESSEKVIKFLALDRVYVPGGVGFDGDLKLIVRFKEKSFHFKARLQPETQSFRNEEYSVFELIFDDETTYSQWVVFFKVIHKTKLKKQVQSLL